MRNGEWNKVVSVAGRILLSFLFVFSQSAWAGQDQKTKDKADPAQKANAQQIQVEQTPAAQSEKAQSGATESPSTEEPASGPGHEGIKVHGHWTIEVRNPDGTLVTHREFENSLAPSTGSQLLANLLNICTASSCPSANKGWLIILSGNPQPCTQPDLNDPGQSPGPCILSQPGNSLTASVQGTTFVLRGSLTAGATGSIGTVATAMLHFDGSLTNFTSTTLPAVPVVSVAANQIVQVTVVISFS